MLVLPLNKQHDKNGFDCGDVQLNHELPETLRKRLPVKVPVFRLGRLATKITQRGKGIGEFMLFDAIDRVTLIAGEVGGIGLVVSAKPLVVGISAARRAAVAHLKQELPAHSGRGLQADLAYKNRLTRRIHPAEKIVRL